MVLEERGIHQDNIDNQGFSLVELLISVAILAILVGPLFYNFVTAARVNSNAKNIQNETVLAQNILEDIKKKSVSDLASIYLTPVGFHPVANQLYYFAKENIEYNGRKYDALITLDSTSYSIENPMDPGGDRIGINTFQMPVISKINQSKNVLAIQSYETDLALAVLYGNHLTYNANQKALHKDDPYYSITEYTAEDIKSSLHKQMNLNIKKSAEDIQTIVSFEYSCPTIPECGIETYTLVDKQIAVPMGSIYVFYYPSYVDSITIQKESLITDDFDIYMVKQESVDTSVSETIHGSIPAGIHIYSNGSFVGIDNQLVKKEEAKNRIYDVKIQLYQAGAEYKEEELYIELNSTKEE